MKRAHFASVLLSLAVSLGLPAARAEALSVLVTNDDGIDAPGIAAVVAALAENPEVELHIIAPAMNQSGTGDRITEGPLVVLPSQTSNGFSGFAVEGFPADTVLWGVLQELDVRPDLIVSGINTGQNVAELVNISGTVGAALTAARFGIPAFAVSQGLSAQISFDEAAEYTADLVEEFRTNGSFRRMLEPLRGTPSAHVLNINFPTCNTGSLRGVRAVRLGRAARVVGYDELSSDTWQAVLERTPIGSNDCNSTLQDPRTDLEAMNNGFASVTPLGADLTDEGLIPRIRRLVEQPGVGGISSCLAGGDLFDAEGRIPVGTCGVRLPQR